ncbi:hypothetical protein [Neptuniibacter halophilus]|uniref:hypothetical protein n=1 Tax=Neptuniibacter halophilus TaxID=651666 RepID=UPI002573FF83|nr:hypothetical protein [Neptuniibacter halophilus]
MTEMQIWFVLAYGFLTALLLLVLIYGRLKHWLKTILLILVLLFYGGSYQGWKEVQGWPAERSVPERFLLHAAVIEEPDQQPGSAGSIYLWLSNLSEDTLAERPRAYRLEYDQALHGRVERALREMRNGQLQLGEVKPLTALRQQEKQKGRTGQKYPQLEFVRLPDPALPEK